MTPEQIGKVFAGVCIGLSSEVPMSVIREAMEKLLASDILDALAAGQTMQLDGTAERLMEEIAGTPVAQEMLRRREQENSV